MKYRIRPFVLMVAIASLALAGCWNPARSDLDPPLDEAPGDIGNGTIPPYTAPDDLLVIPYREFVAVDGEVFLQEGGLEWNLRGHFDAERKKFEHDVSGFQIGAFNVTYELWWAVRGWAHANGYIFANAGREGSHGQIGLPPTESGKHQPVTTVSWFNVAVWANAYSEMLGRTPVYYMDEEHENVLRDASIGQDLKTAYTDWSADGYRLPTEGEWEYAARWRGNDNSVTGVVEYPDGSGRFWTPSEWASGAGDSYLNEAATNAVAWYAANAGGSTHAVGGRTANQLGIYDMGGNVWEWMWDWLAAYPDTPQNDYRGPDSGTYRAGRGGSWNRAAEDMRTGVRSGARPSEWLIFTGFRLVTRV